MPGVRCPIPSPIRDIEIDTKGGTMLGKLAVVAVSVLGVQIVRDVQRKKKSRKLHGFLRASNPVDELKVQAAAKAAQSGLDTYLEAIAAGDDEEGATELALEAQAKSYLASGILPD